MPDAAAPRGSLVPVIMGVSLDGKQHITTATYPSTMDTRCGLRQHRATSFATRGHWSLERVPYCRLCIVAVKKDEDA